MVSRRDLKAAALCEFAKQGEHGEAGSRAARVNEPTCDQIPEGWSDTNCLVSRRDLKPAALYEFEHVSAKGEYREGGPGRKLRQQFDVGQIPEGWSDTNCLVSRRDLKPAALYEFEHIRAKGEYREGGPGCKLRQQFDVGQIFNKIKPRKRGV